MIDCIESHKFERNIKVLSLFGLFHLVQSAHLVHGKSTSNISVHPSFITSDIQSFFPLALKIGTCQRVKLLIEQVRLAESIEIILAACAFCSD